MQKIKNLKLSKSYRQKQDFVTALKSKKRMHLQNTDWTQLEDVAVKNQDDIDAWRKSLRDFEIDIEANEQTERELDGIIARKPVPSYESKTEKINVEKDVKELLDKINRLQKDNLHLRKSLNTIQLENNEKLEKIRNEQTPVETEEEDIALTKDEAQKKIEELFIEYKNETLMKAGILEYNLKKLLLEEAVDKKFSEPKERTLLSDNDDVEEVIRECKAFFRNINSIYLRLKKEESSIYNMSIQEINNWFKENGYRYRCEN